MGEDERIESSRALIIAPLPLVSSFLGSFFLALKYPLRGTADGKRPESDMAAAMIAIGRPDLASEITMFWLVIGDDFFSLLRGGLYKICICIYLVNKQRLEINKV